MKFKIGDRVKIIKKNEGWPASNSPPWLFSMNITINKIGKIIEILDESPCENWIRINFSNYPNYYYSPDSLQLAIPYKKIIKGLVDEKKV